MADKCHRFDTTCSFAPQKHLIKLKYRTYVLGEVAIMAVWQCSACGETKESRCKPKKCAKCEASSEQIVKVEVAK